VIKTISELHRIELSIFNICKQLPVISYSDLNSSQLEQLKLEQQQKEAEEIGLTHEPLDNNNWYQYKDCQRWFRYKLIDNCCNNCTLLLPPYSLII